MYIILYELLVEPLVLAFIEVLVKNFVKLESGGGVVPERLLDDHSRPAASRRTRANPFDDRLDDVGWDGEVADAVACDAALLVELGQDLRNAVEEGFLVHEIGRHVAHSGSKSLPDVVAELVAA